MSAALVRQALALVDPEEHTKVKRTKRAASFNRPGVAGQDHRHNNKKSKKNKEQVKTKEQIAEENVKKLLALSKPTASSVITKRIVERAIKGKPLVDKVVVKKDEGKSILFPEDHRQKKQSFKKFEDEYFCS